MSDQQMKLGDVEKSLGNFEILELGNWEIAAVEFRNFH